jgi:transcription antitermination factor NusG
MLAALHWYAIKVRAGTEFAVEAILERRGFVAIVPMHTEYRRANRYVQRKTKRSYVIAPSYVLIGFNEAQLRGGVRARVKLAKGKSVVRLVGAAAPWEQVFAISMVMSVVGLGEQAWRMDGEKTAIFIKENGSIEAPVEFEHMGMRAGREFKVGDMVQVVEGSLAGLTARVAAIDGIAAKVLLPLFGKQDQEFPLKVSDLEPVDDFAKRLLTD